MAAYLLRKLRDTIFTLLLVSVIVYYICVDTWQPRKDHCRCQCYTQIAFIEAELGLDQPLPIRFINYLFIDRQSRSLSV